MAVKKIEAEPEVPSPPKITAVTLAGPNDGIAAWGVTEDGTVIALVRDGNTLVPVT
ncbi:MAG: hypothetical protein ACREJP_10370 [Candidatus Methylomirabilales bacterium]